MKQCKRGHLRTLVNSQIDKNGKWKSCKDCQKILKIRWRADNQDYYRSYYKNYNRSYIMNNPIKERKRWINRHHGITSEEYDVIFQKQGAKCGNRACITVMETKNRHLDHCHVTNKIRGILCNRCNLALGLLRDNLEIINGLALYLNENK
jgi:hypothetical protein